MYLQLFQDIMGFISITDNLIVDSIILIIAAKILHTIVYSLVGTLYGEGIITGSFLGRVAYFTIWLICLIPSVFILYLLGRIIAFFKWIF